MQKNTLLAEEERYQIYEGVTENGHIAKLPLSQVNITATFPEEFYMIKDSRLRLISALCNSYEV